MEFSDQYYSIKVLSTELRRVLGAFVFSIGARFRRPYRRQRKDCEQSIPNPFDIATYCAMYWARARI